MNLRLSLAGAQSFIKGAPWIDPQDQLSFRQPPAAGMLLRVQTAEGDFLGWCVSDGPHGAPAFRVLSRERHVDFGAAWAAALVEQALAKRRGLALPGGPQRLIHAEADALPGLSVDVCDGIALASYRSPGLFSFAELLEAPLVQQARLRGLWVRQAAGEGWTPWTRSARLPLSPARFTVNESGLSAGVDLEKEADGPGLPWPIERRRWRAWAQEQSAGQRVLVLGGLEGEAKAARPGAAELSTPAGSIFKALAQARGLKPQRLLIDVPESSKESFGKFDAAQHLSRLLADVAGVCEPGALLLCTSEVRPLWHAKNWEEAWAKACPQGAPSLEAVLGPEPDFPEHPQWVQGRARKAFIFKIAN
jgi:23S rRNA G2069 N7-methylase RlmK/C1962 C5-methylase RlmI